MESHPGNRLATMEAEADKILIPLAAERAEAERLGAIDERRNGAEVAAFNDQAQLEIYGSQGRTYHDPETGKVFADAEHPIPGKLAEYRDVNNSKLYGYKESEREERANTYEAGINDLLEDDFELCQAKLIMDRREEDMVSLENLVHRNITERNMDPEEARDKAAGLYIAKDEKRVKAVKENGIFSDAEYDNFFAESKPKKADTKKANPNPGSPDPKSPEAKSPEAYVRPTYDEVEVALQLRDGEKDETAAKTDEKRGQAQLKIMDAKDKLSYIYKGKLDEAIKKANALHQEASASGPFTDEQRATIDVAMKEAGAVLERYFEFSDVSDNEKSKMKIALNNQIINGIPESKNDDDLWKYDVAQSFRAKGKAGHVAHEIKDYDSMIKLAKTARDQFKDYAKVLGFDDKSIKNGLTILRSRIIHGEPDQAVERIIRGESPETQDGKYTRLRDTKLGKSIVGLVTGRKRRAAKDKAGTEDIHVRAVRGEQDRVLVTQTDSKLNKHDRKANGAKASQQGADVKVSKIMGTDPSSPDARSQATDRRREAAEAQLDEAIAVDLTEVKGPDTPDDLEAKRAASEAQLAELARINDVNGQTADEVESDDDTTGAPKTAVRS